MINVTKSELPNLKEYQEYVKQIWKRAWLTNNGKFVRQLEKKLPGYIGGKLLSLVTNGTLAMQLAIKALNLKGEIITTPFTFPATTNVILWEGCTPVFADIDPETYNIDPADIEKKITNKTSAILAVHVYGNPCATERLEKLAKKNGLKIIYDAAHAFGVKYKNKLIGSYGDISTFSFHATKVFNTIEGGAITTNSIQINKDVNLLRNFGITGEEEVVLAGINAKMSEFQAAMGLLNLKKINSKILLRKKIYELYKRLLQNNSSLKFQKLVTPDYNYAYLPILFSDRKTRDLICAKLGKKGIKPRKYFYPLTNSYKFLTNYLNPFNMAKSFPNAVKISDGILCLPLYSELKLEIVEKICQFINKYTK